MPRYTPAQLEAKLEHDVVVAAAQMGITSLKFTPHGQRGWPDRIFLLPGGRCVFIEFKQKGEKLRALQEYRVSQLRQLGFLARRCDTRHEALTFLHQVMNS